MWPLGQSTIVSRPSKKPSVQEELALAVVMLVFWALVLFGLIVKSSQSFSQGLKVVTGALVSLVALLAMLVMVIGQKATEELAG